MNAQNKFVSRQRALSEFGDFVLDHEDLDEILKEGCRLVAEALGADLAKVLEIERATNTGIVRAGVGWDKGIVGHQRVDLSERSCEAYAIKKSEPVITNDLAREERFVFPSFLTDHHVVALVNVPIFLPGRKPYGVLQVDAREPREFDQEDIEFLKTYSMTLGPVIDRLLKVSALSAADERLRLIVENAHAYVLIVIDANDRITDWLGGSEAILGWSAQDAIGQTSEIIFTEEDRNAGIPDRELSTARAEGAAADMRWHQRKDGSRVFLDGQTIALRDHNGHLRGYYKIAQDNTDRKLNEDRQGFLLALSDTLRSLSTPGDIASIAIRNLGKELGADRVIYGEIFDGQLKIDHEYAANAPSIIGRHSLEPLGRNFLSVYRSGTLTKSSDVATDPRFDNAARANLSERQIAAFADLVLFDDRDEISFLGVQNTTSRPWSASDDYLIREVGDRVRSAIDRVKAEAAVRESEARMRQFGEASSDVIWMRDARSLQWDYLSPAFETIYGLPVHEALAGDDLQTWTNLIVEEDRERVREGICKVCAGEQITMEFRVRRPDGGVRWLRDTDFPIHGPSGEVERIGGIGQDITEMKRAQDQLEQNEERLRSAVEVGRLGLWDWNVLTGEVHWSDEHFRMEGYAVGEVNPSYEAWVARIHPDDLQVSEEAVQAAMQNHTEFVHEFRTLHPDGSEHWLSGRGRFFYDEAARPVRMIGSMIETTERRTWEDRQKVLVAELQHRTRNLIGVVRSMADKTARASTDFPDFRARFRDRLDALSRVQGLLSRLNDVDRVTFEDLLHTELAAMGVTSDKVTLNGPNGVRLRSSTVQTLAMALHELATNAVKYGALSQPDAHLQIAWSFEAAGDKGKPWLHIDWRERGVVMAAEGSAPRGTGQGRELIEQALPYQLSAKTTYTLGPDGVHCVISIPVSDTTSEAGHD
ncbi:PAS domain S-box-containing protein [Rhizobium sp. NFR07]|uniref:PAS domain-containing protein n=1 Tax=Rhizobium sp. NFR07 TaxID=1566262 RepID=UPI0008E6693C|nr:PAS domain-containing protein [Rhizobium sp. NFR07]SFB59116.1 PAS domain S-box-containing protein [Rhizobium sp. NFR07]